MTFFRKSSLLTFLSAVPAIALNLYTTDYNGSVTSLSFSGCANSYSLNKTSNITSCGGAPSWLTLDKQSNTLYCVDESATKNGSLWAYSINPAGKLTPVASNISTLPGPVNSALYGGPKHNSFLALANYGAASIETFALPLKDGSKALQSFPFKGSNATADQAAAHPHQVLMDPTHNFLLSSDLGADMVHVFSIDQTNGTLTQCEGLPVKPGSGPRHMAFQTDGANHTTMYLANELSGYVSSWIVAYPKEGCMAFTLVKNEFAYKSQANITGATTAETRIMGNNLYVSTRNDSSFGAGIDGIATFALTPGSANFNFTDAVSTYGAGPRTFDISFDGQFVAIGNQLSGEVVILSRDTKTGALGTEVASYVVTPPTNVTYLGLSSVIWDQ